ncbi:Coiled-coil domain-containing protein, partial [Schistosoma japonicum]
LTDLLRSLSDNKEQVKRQGDTIEAYEFEQRASRETISRLSGEVNKEQTLRQAAENSEREIKQELEKIETAYKRSEGCIHLLEERVNSLTQSLQAARNDAVEREKQLHKITKVEAMFQSKVVDNNLPNQSSKLELEKYHWNSDDLHEIQKFIDTMVSWLSFPQADKLSSLFNAVLRRIEEMEESLKHNTQAYTDIESELNNLREERLDYNSNFNMLKERITFLEEHKASDSTLIDELRNERDRLHYHLCKLAQILKIDEPIADLGAEILGDALSVRLTQLQQGETEKQTNQRIQISRLQKELRETKDRAESLDLQVGVMRRRLIEAQENRHQTVLPASATPMTLATSEKERRKLIKQLENVKELESNLRQEIVMLKARLLESSQTKLAQMSISKALRAAQNKIDELGSICESRDNELKKLTTELNESRKHSNIELENQNEELLKLRQEINHLQTLLNSSQKSEEHLLEFRKLVAIYLGLDNEQLTIPDYEILTHLDRLVSANQSQAANAVATERAVDLLTGNIRSNVRNHYDR